MNSQLESSQVQAYYPTSGLELFSRANNVAISGSTIIQTGSYFEDTRKIVPSDSYDEPSAKLWSIYVAEAEKFDKDLMERWKGDMDGLLIFAGLFAAVTTAFIIESYKQLTADPTSNTDIILSQIYHQLASSNSQVGPNITQPANFKPSLSLIIVNALWFISLVLSIITALTATLVEQWARYYLQAVRRQSSPQTRARIRSYLYAGVTEYHVGAVVDGVPALLHASVFFFLAGLSLFLLTIHPVIGTIILVLTSLFACLYIGVTIGPLIIPNSPYRSPLSTGCWWLINSILASRKPGVQMQTEMHKVPESIAVSNTFSRDQVAISWTIQSIIDDRDLEAFIHALPDYLASGDNDTGKIIRSILLDSQIFFLGRITGLVKTLTKSELNGKESRLKRAKGCFAAIASILPYTGYSHSDGTFALLGIKELIAAISSLTNDSQAEIKYSAKEILEDLSKKIDHDLAALLEVSEPLKLPRALQILQLLTSLPLSRSRTILPQVTEWIRSTVTTGGNKSHLYSDPLSVALENHFNVPENKLLDTTGDLSSTFQSYVDSLITWISYTSLVPWHKWNPNLYISIGFLRVTNETVLAQYANCCASRLVLSLQSDMICALWAPGNIRCSSADSKDLYFRGQSMLRFLNMVGPLLLQYPSESLFVRSTILLSVTMRIGDPFPDLEHTPGQLQNQLSQLKSQNVNFPFDLDRVPLEPSWAYSDHSSPSRIPVIGKLLLSRGRAAVLVAFLHGIRLSDDVIEDEVAMYSILSTLTYISNGLIAHLTPSEVQKLLVKGAQIVVDQCDAQYQKLSRSTKKIMKNIVSLLFKVTATVGTEEARSLAQEFLMRPATINISSPEVTTVRNHSIDLLNNPSFPSFTPMSIEVDSSTTAYSGRLAMTTESFGAKIFAQCTSGEKSKFKRLWDLYAKELQEPEEPGQESNKLLSHDDIGKFLHALSGRLKCNIYTRQYSIESILAISKPKSRTDLFVNLKNLNRALNKINYKDIKARRQKYEYIYYQMLVTSGERNGVSISDMKSILGIHKLSSDTDIRSASLPEAIVEDSMKAKVKDIISMARVKAWMQGRKDRLQFVKDRTKQMEETP